MLRGIWPVLLTGMVALSAGASGCRSSIPDESQAKMELAIEPQPPVQGPAKVTITMTGSEGAPISGAELRLEGNMSHPGMVPVFADARELAPGRYLADLEFTMGGDWFIIVTARLPGNRRLERQFPVRGVRSR